MTTPRTRDELVEMAHDLSDLRHMRGFHYRRSYDDVISQGRAWCEFEMACRASKPHDAYIARQQVTARMWRWHSYYEALAKRRLAEHPASWINGEAAGH